MGEAVTFVQPRQVSHILAENHYLGPSKRGIAWQDQYGVIIVASPTSRRLPVNWLELVRWCITSNVKNAGSRQWAQFSKALRILRGDVTTIVSYSDPSVGHTGALYRACNWWWAPTWHRLRTPPTGNGSWQKGKIESAKDRWVFAFKQDKDREKLLVAQDQSVLRLKPWARYKEPGGADFKRFSSAKEPKT